MLVSAASILRITVYPMFERLFKIKSHGSSEREVIAGLDLYPWCTSVCQPGNASRGGNGPRAAFVATCIVAIGCFIGFLGGVSVGISTGSLNAFFTCSVVLELHLAGGFSGGVYVGVYFFSVEPI